MQEINLNQLCENLWQVEASDILYAIFLIFFNENIAPLLGYDVFASTGF